MGASKVNRAEEDKSSKCAQQPCCESEVDITMVIPAMGRAPDGGWGWIIVLASLLCNVIVDGICYSFGVYKKELAEHFGTSNAQVNWVGSLLAGCYLTVGPLVSALCTKYGCRRVTMIGAIVAAAAFLISMQTDSIEGLTVIYGVFGGMGFGMIYLPAIVTVGHWFEKKRAFATGIVVCGSGMGMLAFPPFVRYLVDEYSWKGAHMILAGVVLNCFALGAVFRPLELYRPRKPRRVEIQRGSIMKALIEEKKRQRTISNGSLDNCIITKDNRLIKIDPSLFEQRGKNSSIIARLRESLGFSTKSLNRSKASLVLPSIMIDPQTCNGNFTPKSTPIYKPGAKIYRPQAQHSQPITSTDQQVKMEALASNDSGYSTTSDTVYRAKSVDIIPQDDPWLRLSQENALNTKSLSFHSVNNPVITVPGVGSHIISIQVVPTDSRNSLQHRRSVRSVRSSNRSVCSSQGVPCSVVENSIMSIPQYSASVQSVETLYEESTHDKSSALEKVFSLIKDMFDFRLLKSCMFLLLLIAAVMSMLGFFIPFFCLPQRAEELGISKSDGALILSITGITNTIGRVISGWIADRPCADPLHLNNWALILAGIATILVPFGQDFIALAVYAAFFGLCIAMFVSLRSILLVDLLGLDMLTKSFGILILFQGIATIAGPPLAGKLQDVTGSVSATFYMAGSLITLSGLMCIPLRKLKDVTFFKRERQLPEEEPFNETVTIEQLETTM